MADLLCAGKLIRGGKMEKIMGVPKISHYTREMNNKEIIESLCENLVFEVSPQMQNDMETLLKYDFNANNPNADAAILRVFNYLIKTPEFQLI